ncbi:MAG: 16S rRNA (adenine(1518)-N(6)/adenine(1519)-N(6))-dimethyltransferase RsmA [Candidatus Dormibacteria bacterium]
MTRTELDLTNPATVRAVARRVGMHQSRRLGQHFLVDRAVLEAVVDALQPAGSDEVLEIGCGIGTLTGALAARVRRVIAIDVDVRCIAAAQITQRHRSNVTVLEQDVTRVDAAALGVAPTWLAAGNLPYHLTGPILSRLFEGPAPPRRGVFLVQREVAARLAAEHGEWSLATVALRSIATIERVRDVPPSAFQPPPAVDSAVVRLQPRAELTPAERSAVIRLARRVFQQRRKTIRHGIAHALGGEQAAARAALEAATIDSRRRPGTLDLDEWRRLAGAVAGVGETGRE